MTDETQVSRASNRAPFRWARLAYSAILVSLVGGCALMGRNESDDLFQRNVFEGPLWLEVQNDHFSDARIYAVWGGQRERIGMVIGKTTEVMETQWRDRDLRIQVDFVAAGGFTTDRVLVSPGETLYFQIPAHAR